MKRVKLIVAYDGTNYHGWQLQPGAVTIEQVLNEALTGLLGEPIAVTGASRTDAGVHALGNVAVFDTEHRMPGGKVCFALNQRLPADIRVQSSCEVPEEWHPRRCPCIKTYEYRILNRAVELPQERLYAAFCRFPVEIERMRRAAAFLVGEHDFKSFCNVRTQAETTVREIYEIQVERERQGDVIAIRVPGKWIPVQYGAHYCGDAPEGRAWGRWSRRRVQARAGEARDRQAAGPTAPAMRADAGRD